MSDIETLAAHWPDMPDLPDGVDLFAEHPISGMPAAVSVVTLTPLQWRVLTYIQGFERRHTVGACRNSDIQSRCGLESEAKTRAVLAMLEYMRLAQTYKAFINDTWVHCARSNKQATGKVGVSYE